jgi:hypothetical protein
MIGSMQWVIADGWIPATSTGPAPDMISHESACMLNANTETAQVEMMIFFADREPAGPYLMEIPGRRVLHQKFNDLTNPEPVPLATDYSVLITSSVPIVVQHTRLDSRQAENAIMTTIAYPLMTN